MPSHAAPIPFKKRLLAAGALATSVLLMGLGISQVATGGARAASAAFSCDQNTLYAINSSGGFDSIVANSGAATALPSQSPSNNALGITQNGTYAYSTLNATAANANGTLTRYNPADGSTTKLTGVYVPGNTYRGAVDPSTGIYYYAQGNTTKAAVYAYDTNGAGSAIGQVGFIDFAQASTGDFAFSTTGVLYAVSGNQVVRINGKLPTTASTTSDLTSTTIAQLGSVSTSPGIAFSTNGYLYVAVGSSVMQINPSTGVTVATRNIVDSSGAAFTPTDLASCNYADGLSAQTSVDERWKASDQFTMTIQGDADNTLTYGNTATTSGSYTGLQSATAGANLVAAGKAYTVTQTGTPGTDLSDYATTWTCDTAKGVNLAHGSGNVASVTLPTDSDNDVSCQFTNTLTAVHVSSKDDTYYTTTNQAVTNPTPGILANDTAATGLKVVSQTAPSHGTLTTIDPTTGGFTYTPDADYAGADSFTYTTQDSSGTASTSTVTINVGPTAGADTGSVVVGGSLHVDAPGVLGNDGGVNLTASNASTPVHGTVSLSSDGSYTYTPTDPTYTGPDAFTYTVTDGGGHTQTGHVTIAITPKAVDDTLDSIPTDSSLVWDSSKSLANDVGTDLTISKVGPTSAHGGTVKLSDDGSTFTYTPADDFSGVDTFSYTVTDPSGDTGTATETITVTPVAKSDAVKAIALDTTDVIQGSDLTANDRGSDLTIVAVSNAARGTVTLNDDQTITFTPTTGQAGTASFQYTVSDGTTQSTATVYVPVNPAAGAYAETVASGSTLSVDADHGVLSKDADRANETASNPSTPHHGTVTLNSDGSYTYIPSTTYSGPDAFTYTVTDTSGSASTTSPTTSTGTVTITVTPKATGDDLGTITAGTSKTVQPTALTGDDHGSHLSIASVGTVAAGTAVGGDATLNGDGTVTFTPADGFSGPATFQYTITDGTNTSTATVTVQVTPVAVDDTLDSTTADASKTFDADALLGNDLGSGLTLTSVDSASLGHVVLADDGKTFTYTPQPGFSGTYAFSYTAEDSSQQSASATAKIVVTPTAGALSITAVAGTPDDVSAAHGLLSPDSGADGSGLSVALSTDPARTAAHGTVELGDDGAFTYTPADGFSGTDRFDYVVTDQSGGTSTGTVTVIVKPAPADHTLDVAAGDTAPVTTAALLADGQGIGLTVTDVAQPEHGTIAPVDGGGWTYTPADGYSGPDSFDYTVTDSAGHSNTATVAVTVAVAANNDSATTAAGRTLTVSTTEGVLANDHGSALKATVKASPTHGILTLSTDGSYTYVPTDGYSGTDTFTYTATDEHGQTDVATVILTVTPVVVPAPVTIHAGSAAHLDAPGVLAGATGQGLHVTSVDGGNAPGSPFVDSSGSTVTIAADGTVDVIPAAGWSGVDTITFHVAGNGSVGTDGTLTITVDPKAVDDSFTIGAKQTLHIAADDLTGNDLGTQLTVTGIAPALDGTTATLDHGTLVKNTDGTFDYTPTTGFSGTDSFDYTVTDRSGLTSSATATIIVGDLAPDYTQAQFQSGVGNSVGRDTGLLSKASGTGLTASIDRKAFHGTVDLDPATGAYTYTPTHGYSGTDSFTYQVEDATHQISTGLVTITVLPTVTDDSGATTAGDTLTLAAPGVLHNDSGSGLHVTSVGTPSQGGTAAISGSGELVYTPKPGFSGVETVTYSVTDENGLVPSSAAPTATVTITVTPTSMKDTAQTIAGRRVSVNASSGLLANDTGSELVAALKTAPKHGTVTVNADGSYTYKPAKGFAGQDTFTYTATDGSGQVTTSTATVTVLATAVAKNVEMTGTPGKKVTLTPLANDTPTSGANFDPSTLQLIDPSTGTAVSSFTVPGKGVFRVTDGQVVFTPARHFSGRASVAYQVSDSADVLVSATLTVVYPTAAQAAAAAGSGSGSGSAAGPGRPVAGAPAAGTTPAGLAFTGSRGVGGMLLIGFGAALMGLVLVLMRRFRRPMPGPRRLGL